MQFDLSSPTGARAYSRSKDFRLPQRRWGQIGIDAYPGPSNTWSIDIWITNNPVATAFEFTDRLLQALNAEHREAIIQIKEAYQRRGLLRNGISKIIYEAVIDYEVRDLDGFLDYLKMKVPGLEVGSMEKKHVSDWIEGYKQAWNSNDPGDIGRLFAEDAEYYTGPFQEPWKGREGIIAGWLERRDEPGTYSFRYEVLAASDNVGVVRGWTKYFEPEKEYSNIWVIRFDDQGRCTEFTEWWMRRKQLS